jgi:hypothetical protein
MSDELYVTTDAEGIEHAALGRIKWVLPSEGVATNTTSEVTLILRRADALLEELDERIFRATSDEKRPLNADDTLEVTTARLVSETSWNPTTATRFALGCAKHLLDEIGAVALPNGTSLTAVLDDASKVLDGISTDAVERLDYLARVRALRRLRHTRREIAEQSSETLADDDVKDRLEHGIEDRKKQLSVPTILVSPFGASMSGGGPNIEYDPAWTSAREAARHARMAIKDLNGSTAEAKELKWQADTLEHVLNS